MHFSCFDCVLRDIWQQHVVVSWREPLAHASIFNRFVWVFGGSQPKMYVLPTGPLPDRCLVVVGVVVGYPPWEFK